MVLVSVISLLIIGLMFIKILRLKAVLKTAKNIYSSAFYNVYELVDLKEDIILKEDDLILSGKDVEYMNNFIDNEKGLSLSLSVLSIYHELYDNKNDSSSDIRNNMKVTM